MASRPHQEARPRTVGEILDDAWRLCRDDAPLLLAASGLFFVPALCLLLIVLTEPFPTPGAWRYVWPALAAALLPLTGLGAGAYQEAFHLWTEDRPATLGRCLHATLRRGLNHAASQVLILLLPMLAFLCLASAMLPAVRWLLAILILTGFIPLWMFSLTRHAVLTAGQRNLWRAWRLARRASSRDLGKAVVLTLVRVLLPLVVFLNLHLGLRFALNVADNLAGLNVAYLRVMLVLSNPIYLVALAGLVCWLLTPYLEATNYLFLVDARTRYDGLDLWYRIETLFPVRRAARAGALVLAAAGALLVAAPLAACQRVEVPEMPNPIRGAKEVVGQPKTPAEHLQEIQAARADLKKIATEIKEAEPYRGGAPWIDRLRQVGRRLDKNGDSHRGRYRWFFQAVERFGNGGRVGDVKALKDADRRLALVEESLKWQPPPQEGASGPSADDIRGLVPPLRPSKERPKREPPVEKDEPPKKEPKEPPREAGPPRSGGGGAGMVGPVGGLGGSLGYLCLFVCAVLLGAVIVVGIVILVRNWLRNRKPKVPGQVGVNEAAAENVLEEPDKQNVAGLWRQSDELARAGRFLEAVRTLYLAVLALLHQAHLIRYERTRTNGEYADQLRRQARPVHRPFLGLTGLFEVKWYGERACRPEDYQTCRGLAETIQEGVSERRPEGEG
jgi:hypothetical protein